MDHVKPAEVLEAIIGAGADKAALGIRQMLVKGILAGAILACATTLAFTATQQTSLGIVGALIFPVGFVIIILLGLELVTGSFALIPLAVLERKASFRRMLANFGWVILGHLLGCALYAVLYGLTITKMGTDLSHPLVHTLITTSEAKTLGYKAMGLSGLGLVLIKAVLCNWMVTLGAVMAFTSRSTAGKIIAMWLPILIFFAQGFEHAVVNMFVIPAGMLLGAKVSLADWWVWNQLPVLAGNLIGGVTLTGLGLYFSLKKKASPAASSNSPVETGEGRFIPVSASRAGESV